MKEEEKRKGCFPASPLTWIHPPFLEGRRLRFLHTWCMGGITLFLILSAGASGFLLLFLLPSLPSSPGDLAALLSMTVETEVYGRVLLDLHRYSFWFLLLTLSLHGLKVYIRKAYRPPGEMVWVAGVLLILFVAAQGITGELMTGEGVGIDSGAFPFSTVFLLHILALPVALLLLVFTHLILVRKNPSRGL